jgi:aminomethyltransferase
MAPDSDPLQRTPLHAAHIALGAKMMGFGGFDMPVQYSGILAEHRAVREAAGLFDVSHMGEVEVAGPDALAFVQLLVTNDVSVLTPPTGRFTEEGGEGGEAGRALYAAMCDSSGGTVDDLLVYRLSDRDGQPRFLLVINASNIDKDLAHIREVHASGGFDCTVTDESDETALLAIQGPKALEIAQALTDLPLADIPYYRFAEAAPGAFAGASRALVSRTGYTGEPGLELYLAPDEVEGVWNKLMAAGAEHGLLPAGLGARDTLRLEAGFSLYGHELSDAISPLEAGLGWVVKLQKDDFVGHGALAAQKENGVPRRVVGLLMEERGIPRQGCAVTSEDEEPVGEITSGSQSPTLGRGMALALVKNDPAYTEPGASLCVVVRGRPLQARVVKPPFHKLDA